MIFFLNAVNVIAVLVGFAVQILIVRFFGASDASDVYYLVVTITTFVAGLSTGFLTDLFVPIYHDAKKKSFEVAQRLAGSLLTLSLIVGFVVSAAVYVFSPSIVILFASGFSDDKTTFAAEMLRTIAFSIPFVTISAVLNSTLNANSFLKATYLVNLIAPVFSAVAIVVAGSVFGVAALMYAAVAASAAGSLILFAYCKLKLGARFANPFRQKDIPYLLLKNVPVRMTNIVNLLRGPVTTTALSYFPVGSLTLYSYAERIVMVLLGLANSPMTQYYFIRSSELATIRDFDEIRRLLKRVVRHAGILFAGLFFGTAVIFQDLFAFLFGSKVSSEGIRTMFVLFIALFPFSYVSLIASQIAATGLAMKKGRVSLFAAFVFIGTLALVIYPLMKMFSVFGLPVTLFVAQVLSVLAYVKLLNRIELIVDAGLMRIQVDTFIVAAILITANAVWPLDSLPRITMNSVFFLAWLARHWSGAKDTLTFVTARGEVK